jgi:NAD(P)-dependent dehydrogenase (short-subunit alcohol dehydrogenase family)
MSQPQSSPRIILTGGSRGLGLAILRILLSKYNARVATLSRSFPPDLRAVADKYGDDRVLVVQGDIGKSEDNEAVVRQATNKWGGLDGLVLNAGQLDPVGKLTPCS